jgi:hypothetical protein
MSQHSGLGQQIPNITVAVKVLHQSLGNLVSASHVLDVTYYGQVMVYVTQDCDIPVF